MRRAVITTAVCFVSLCLNVKSLPAQRQTIDIQGGTLSAAKIGAAQLKMLNRIDHAAKVYAREININENWIGYCRGELDFKTTTYPHNGFVPFGVNYNTIKIKKLWMG
jgi:hypothetical protein